MSHKLKIFSYNEGSQGAKALAQELGIKRIKHHGSSYSPQAGDTIIQWGSAGDKQFPPGIRIWNPTNLVKRASNKLAFFKHLLGGSVRTPEWTDNGTVAQEWVQQGHVVVARGVLSGHSGEGITIIQSPLDFVTAPLYTKYVKKEQEYRVHCAFGTVIDVQRKIKRPDFEGQPNWHVRNHANGFIYVRNNVVPPEEVTSQALEAFKASGLHFGAVDVLWNAHKGWAYVLEINTAPGLQGQTVLSYAKAFKQALAGSPT